MLNEMRTISSLRDSSPAKGAADRLSDRQLQAAVENPDHSEAGRQAAAEALQARGIDPLQWRSKVRGYIRAEDLDRGASLFFGWGSRIRHSAAALALTSFALGIAALVLRNPAYAALLVGAGAFAVVWGAAIALRRRPARIAVVRHRSAPAYVAPLRRMLRRELSPFGHVVGMAPDGGVIAPVAQARQYRRLGRKLRSRIALNLRSAISPGATLSVAATTQWRPVAQRFLIDSSDAIVVDLTEAGDAASELDAIRSAGAESRAVFVSIWGDAERAQASLRDAGLSNECFFYAPDGEMKRRSQFRAAMIGAMRAAHGADA